MNEVYGIAAMMFSAMTFFIALMILNKVSRIESLGVGPRLPVELSDAVKEIANDPRLKIAAIKRLRDETGCGLAEAKDAVEAYIRSQNT